MSSVSTSLLDVVEELIVRRRWILEEIRRFEERYGMSSREFYEAWRKGLIPEPRDPETHGDFVVWAGLVEELEEIERELLKLMKVSSG